MSKNGPIPFRALPGRRWVEVAVVVGCLLLLAGVLLPAVYNARQAAKMTQSKNNLRQVGVAMHNYHDVSSVFPLGGDVLANGTAKHGWYTRLVPYLEASDRYSTINFKLAWDHPVNDVVFKQSFFSATIPGVEQCYSEEGYGLLHYMANPNAMHRNHCVSIDEMSTGTANNWLCGEVAGIYQPWGYPFNWRPLHSPLNSGPDSYGAWPSGGYIGLADGSVRLLSNSTDAALLMALANAPPVATSEQTAVRNRRFEYSSMPLRRDWFEAQAEPDTKSMPGMTILYDRSDRPYYADVYSSGTAPVWDVLFRNRIDLEGVLLTFPQVKVMTLESLRDDNVQIVARFRDLEILQARQIELTETGRSTLKSQSNLPVIIQR